MSARQQVEGIRNNKALEKAHLRETEAFDLTRQKTDSSEELQGEICCLRSENEKKTQETKPLVTVESRKRANLDLLKEVKAKKK